MHFVAAKEPSLEVGLSRWHSSTSLCPFAAQRMAGGEHSTQGEIRGGAIHGMVLGPPTHCMQAVPSALAQDGGYETAEHVQKSKTLGNVEWQLKLRA